MSRFALIGAAGYIAPRHMKAIQAVGGELVAAVDPHDSVGVLDRYFPHCAFFTEIERFDRHLEKLRREGSPVEYISICSPNYLHDAHCRLALRLQAHAICEKPLVIKPWNLDALQELQSEFGTNVYPIMQLRYHPAVQALKLLVDEEDNAPHHVNLTYHTRRGAWYDVSWKGDKKKSGGVAMNIGIHFFDMLNWVFGVHGSQLIRNSPHRMSGQLFAKGLTCINWDLSTEAEETQRSLTIDGNELDFTAGFEDLHTKAYEEILAGNGLFIEDARPAIDIVHNLGRV